MPTYLELEAEPEWRAEVTPPRLAALGTALRDHYKVGPTLIGSRGDNKHLAGYHRSRRWIKESRFCTSRTYSVSRTPGDRGGGDPNWVCGLDIGGIGQDELHAMCRRLDVAVRGGRLEKITQWYGSFGDDDRVDGYDNITNRLASADSSHLWHLHLSFDRGRAGEDHSDVLAVLIGDDDMSAQSEAQINTLYALLVDGTRTQGSFTHTPPGGESQPINPVYNSLWRIEAGLRQLGAPAPQPLDVDEAALAAEILKALTPQAIADAISDDLAQGVVDLLAARLSAR